MTRKDYIDCFGDDPVEMFGGDWEGVLQDLSNIKDPDDAQQYIDRDQHFREQLL